MDKSIIKQLLIPLDGSSMAESVLPAAARLAGRIGVAVTLIHILEKDAPETIHGQRHLTGSAQAEEYLNSVASKDIFKDIKVNIHVHQNREANVPRSISEHSEELNQDLVVMCTHGSSGLHGLLFGSIAQQVIALGKVPVLLIKPLASTAPKECSFENFLIPLDGDPDHEHVLNYAAALAKMCGAKIHLMTAVPHFGNMTGGYSFTNRLLPGTTSKMMDMLAGDAKEYLNQLKKRLETDGLKVSVTAVRDDPANAITKTASKIKADIIILATHGKKGVEAFWEGSVTPKVGKTSSRPLLLVPVK